MRSFLLLLCGSLTLVASDNPQELVRKAIDNYQRDAQSALLYTYTTTDISPKGSEVTQVMPLEGTPFERLIFRNGKPISAEEEQHQQERFEEASRKRANETPEQRAKRIKKYREQSNFLRDVPDAFAFTLLPEQILSGRPNYVILCKPKPGYEPSDMKGRMFSKLNAKIWIDKEDLRMTKADAEIIDTMAIGWIMARIGKGGHIELTQIRVANNLWLPKSIDINGNARILLVEDKKVNQQIVFGDFKRVSHADTKDLTRTAIR